MIKANNNHESKNRNCHKSLYLLNTFFEPVFRDIQNIITYIQLKASCVYCAYPRFVHHESLFVNWTGIKLQLPFDAVDDRKGLFSVG